MRRFQFMLRWLGRLNFTDSLVFIFLLLGALWLIHFLVASARGQDLSHIGFISGNSPSAADLQTSARQFQAARVAALKIDPVRQVAGHQENISTAPGWCYFFGKVVSVLPDGVNVYGFYGPVTGPFLQTEEITFFVANYPFPLAEGDQIPMDRWSVAKDVGLATFNTPLKGPRGVHALDYGIPIHPRRPSKTELDQVLAQAIKDRQETDARMRARAATNQPPAAIATNPPSAGAPAAKP